MTKLFMTIFLLLLFVAAATSQTATDLAKKYLHHEVYEVQPGVQMTPKFSADGRVCEMQVETAHFGNNGVDLNDGIDQGKIKGIIDQLVPTEERGEKIRGLEQCAGGCQMIDEYANVSVTVFSGGNTRLIGIKWRNRNCE